MSVSIYWLYLVVRADTLVWEYLWIKNSLVTVASRSENDGNVMAMAYCKELSGNK